MKAKKFLAALLFVIMLTCMFAPNVNAAQKMGDVNGDGEITIRDATDIQKSIVQILTDKDNYNAKYADFDRNGSIDVKDSTLIAKYLVELVIDYKSCFFSTDKNSASLSLQTYYGKSANPNIPGLTPQTNYTLTKISQYAFKDNSTIITVTLPYQVKKIDSYAFYNCKNLTTVYSKNPNLSWGNSFVNCPKFQAIKFIGG